MISFLREGDNKSLSEWSVVLGCAVREVRDLSEKGVFRRSAIDSKNDQQLYSLRFVGVLALSHRIWFSIPSIIYSHKKNAITAQDVQVTIALLQRHEQKLKRKKRYVGGFDVPLFWSEGGALIRDIELLVWLLDWTESHGFHDALETEYSASYGHAINWGATENCSLPIKAGKSFLYDPLLWDKTRHELSGTGYLQAKVIDALFVDYYPISKLLLGGDEDILDAGKEILESHDFFIEDPFEYLRAQEEMLSRDHEKELVSGLLSYFESPARFESNESIFYGTNGFWAVWEDVCNFVFSSSFDDLLLSNPRYVMKDKSIFEMNGQRPDLWYVHEDSVFILDAKYYTGFPCDSKPGVQDIIKQIMYGLSYRGQYNKIILGFVFPGHSSSIIDCIGAAEMAIVSEADKEFPEVHCFILDWTAAVSAYLSFCPIGDIRARIVRVVH